MQWNPFLSSRRMRRLGLDREEQGRVAWRLEQLVVADQRFGRRIAVGGGAYVLSVAAAIIGAGWAIMSADLSGRAGKALLLGATVAAAIGLWCLIMRPIAEPLVRQAMRDCGIDLCGACGYDRRGVDASAPCPECGRLEPAPIADAD